jgi:uncharacterized LabA/DUF88 family protein
LKERIAILIDGQNVHAALRCDGMAIDYLALVAALTGDRYLIRPYFFSIDIVGQDEYRPLRQMLDFLDYHGFEVVTKELQDRGGDSRFGNCSLAVDLASAAFDIADSVQHLILCTGDEQFLPLVQTLQRHGKRVTIATVKVRCADALRRQADHFFDLEPIKARLLRPAKAPREAQPA